jgi:hypothetical protein
MFITMQGSENVIPACWDFAYPSVFIHCSSLPHFLCSSGVADFTRIFTVQLQSHPVAFFQNSKEETQLHTFHFIYPTDAPFGKIK